MSKKRKFYQKKRFIIPTTIGLALIFLGVFGAFYSSSFKTTTNAYVDQYLIKITPKMSAKIIELNTENNAIVKKGEIIAELDGTKYSEKIKELEEEYSKNSSQLQEYNDEIERINQKSKQAKIELELAKTNLENANADYVMYKISHKDGTVTKKDLNKAIQNLELAQVQHEQAIEKIAKQNEELKETNLKKDSKNDDIQSIIEELENTRLDLSASTIIAPKSGKIINLKAKTGDIAQNNETLFEILPDECFISANFKNLKTDEIKQGQKAIVKIYSAGFKRLSGEVVEVIKTPTNTTNVKIKISNCPINLKIKPNAKAYVKIKIK